MRNRYTKEIKEYIKTNSQYYKREELRQEVEKTFGIKISKEQFHQYLWRHNIHCKGYDKSKINNLKNKKPIGSESIKKDGMMVKVKIGDNKWQYKQRLIWEEYYGEKLTDDDYIIFLDQDKTNFDISNLRKISRRESAVLSNRELYSKEPVATETGIKVAKLIIKSKDKKEKYNGIMERYS